MQKEDFIINIPYSGKVQYLHTANGDKRKELIAKVKSGELSQEDFAKEQKKMRGGKYLKYIFSEAQYQKAINEEVK